MFKRYVGIDFVDFLIQLGATIAAAALLASVMQPDDEIGVSLAVLSSFAVLAWRRARVAKAALPEGPAGEAASERMLELEQRVAELEQAQQRVYELEERLDFTERMLVRQRDHDPARLEPGG